MSYDGLSDEAREALDTISAKATHEFMTNPEFHATVQIATAWTLAIAEKHNIELTPSHQSIALQTACLALVAAGAGVGNLLGEDDQVTVFSTMMQSNLAMEDFKRRIANGEIDPHGKEI